MSRFIGPFMDWFLNSTDAPEAFAQASALTCLSTVTVGRRWLAGANRISPNLYMMIIGPSSRARKTTTVRRAQEIVLEVDHNRIGPTDYTAEGLFHWMQEKNPETNKARNKVTLFSTEFAADLSRSESYGNSFRDDLTNLYDGYDVEKVRSGYGKNVKIAAPRVTLLAAITYEALSQYTTIRDWSTGFLMRFLFIAPTEWRETQAVEPSVDYERKNTAIYALQQIVSEMKASGPRPVGFTPEAQEMYVHFYNRHMAAVEAEKAAIGLTDEQPAEIYMQRFWPNVRKMALLFQTDMSPHAEIGPQALERSLRMAAICWESYKKAVLKTTLNTHGAIVGALYRALCAVRNKTGLDELNLRPIIDRLPAGSPVGLPVSVLSEICDHSPHVPNAIRSMIAADLAREVDFNGRKWIVPQDRLIKDRG